MHIVAPEIKKHDIELRVLRQEMIYNAFTQRTRHYIMVIWTQYSLIQKIIK